jgi:hypothetical protein
VQGLEGFVYFYVAVTGFTASSGSSVRDRLIGRSAIRSASQPILALQASAWENRLVLLNWFEWLNGAARIAIPFVSVPLSAGHGRAISAKVQRSGVESYYGHSHSHSHSHLDDRKQ